MIFIGGCGVGEMYSCPIFFFFFFLRREPVFFKFFTKHTAAFTLILAIFFGQKRILDVFLIPHTPPLASSPLPLPPNSHPILISEMIAPLLIASKIWATFKGKIRSDTRENFQDFSWVCVKIIPFWLRH